MTIPHQCLAELTKCVCRTINQINEALDESDPKRRERRTTRILKELELVNDEAMRNGLDMSIRQITQQKTRSRGSSSRQRPASTEPRVLTPFHQLMAHHAKNIVGPIPDPGAQGAAIKWILQHFTPELAIKTYDAQLADPWWSQRRVSWLSVKQQIGRIQPNATIRTPDARERNAERLNGNLALIQELRSDDRGDNNQEQHRPEATGTGRD